MYSKLKKLIFTKLFTIKFSTIKFVIKNYKEFKFFDYVNRLKNDTI